MRRVSSILQRLTAPIASNGAVLASVAPWHRGLRQVGKAAARGAAILDRLGEASGLWPWNRQADLISFKPWSDTLPGSVKPLISMSAEELLHFYQIDDPVYRGLVKWRIESLRQWKLKFLKEKARVLEIGTGHFPFALALAQDTSQMDYVGLEPDPGMNQRAQLHVKGKFNHSTLLTARWGAELVKEQNWDQAFDVICSFEVFEHIRAEEGFIRNASAALRPGGFLILETPNADVTPLFVKVFQHAPDGGGQYQDSDHVNERGFRDLFNDIRKENFEIVDFACYYMPVSLWDDKALEPFQQDRLYQYIHRAASLFPFYSYAQMFLAQKKV